MVSLVVILVVVLVVGLVVVVRSRAVRRARLAGITSVRPVFMVEPPTRRMTARHREAL